MDISNGTNPLFEKLLSGVSLSDLELDVLRKAIRPDKIVKMITIQKSKSKIAQLRRILSVLYPNQKQYRWDGPRPISPGQGIFPNLEKHVSLKTIVSGGGANSTGKKK